MPTITPFVSATVCDFSEIGLQTRSIYQTSSRGEISSHPSNASVSATNVREWDDDERGEFYTIDDRVQTKRRLRGHLASFYGKSLSDESSSSEGSEYRETVHEVADDPDHPFWDIRYRLYETDDSWEYNSGLSIIPGSNSDSDNYSDDDNPAI